MYIAILDSTGNTGDEVDIKIQKIKKELIDKTKQVENKIRGFA